jgi:single-strand DNA-binding protein
MAKSLNRCEFIGNLGKDPEIRYLQNGDAVANFSIACGESWTDKNTGEKVEKTEWVNIVAWRKLAEICGEYLKKGNKVFVAGKFTTEKWDKDGVTHYTTKVVINEMLMLSGMPNQGQGSQNQSAPQQSTPPPAAPPAAQGDFDDDIPF